MAVGCRLMTYNWCPEYGWDNQNIGDLFQTIALSRFLPPSVAVVRDARRPKTSDLPFVVNGLLGEPKTEQGENCLFAGIHIVPDAPVEKFLPWFAVSRYPVVGVRDPATRQKLWKCGLSLEMTGCATLTFPRHVGPRDGIYAVDCDAPGEKLSHLVPKTLSLSEGWDFCLTRLALYERAKAVYTSRLHCMLACLAMGTPVTFIPVGGMYDESRLSLLDYMGLDPGVEVVKDVTGMRNMYVSFLARHLDLVEDEHDPVMPELPPEPEPAPAAEAKP